MLTKRSRRDNGTFPSDSKPSKGEKSGMTSHNVPKTHKSLKESVGPRLRSRSCSAGAVRTRSKSAVNRSPINHKHVSVKKQSAKKSIKDAKRKNSVERTESQRSELSTMPSNNAVNRRSSNFVGQIKDNHTPTLMTRSMTSLLANGRSESLLQLSKNTRIKNKNNIKNSGVELGELLGNSLLAISLPCLVILSKIALQNGGIIMPFPQGYLQYRNYFNQDVYIWSSAFLIIQLLIPLIPLAKTTRGLQNNNSKNWFSGFMNLVVIVSIIGVLKRFEFSIKFILDMVIEKTVPHVVSSVVFALIISTGLLVTAKLKKQISKFNKLTYFQNFFIGTYSNPSFGPITIKLALYRYSLISTILFNYLIILDILKNPVNLPLYVAAGLQIFYALDKLLFEFHLLPSFYLQEEKCGYWTIMNILLQPAINFLPIQILLAKTLPVNYVVLSISVILFLFGHVCQRYCHFVKYTYESSSFIKKLFGTRKLTDFGKWLFVKYPNNAGTLINHFSIMLLTIDLTDLDLDCLLTSWPVFLYALYYVVFLFY